MFINQETLWTYTLPRNPQAYLADNNLGLALFNKGQVDEAIAQLQEVVRLNPLDSRSQNNLAKMQAAARQAPRSK
jgi:Flp pilus assembly protein TadD